MRSYYSHLETAMGTAKQVSKPVFRSSAIFPMIYSPGEVSSRIIFMGYWLLKRHIKQISAVVTLREENGALLSRSSFPIEEAKTFRVELVDFLSNAGLSLDNPFVGSMEIEFFSSVNLVFPYPAVAINYYGPSFSSVVHTAQRVYNDFEDMRNNSQTSVPESGFNIYVDDNHEPFIGFINGPEAVENGKLDIQFYNSDQQVVHHSLDLGKINPYQTHLIYPAKLFDLKKFLKGKAGAAKLRFEAPWIFPRLLVGNVRKSPASLTITHSYYDCSQAVSEKDYWLETQPEWYPASLMVPVLADSTHFTHIDFYPIYSPSHFTIDIEIYDRLGKLLGIKQNVIHVTPETAEFICIKISDLFSSLPECNLSARVIARTLNGHRLPARVKIALDIGQKAFPLMPCNICTNLHPFNPPLETKPSTFHWMPLLADQPDSSIWIMNSAPNINYTKTAEVQLDFYREKDTASISRVIQIPPHGFIVIKPNEDAELNAFFEGQIGWCTTKSTNPYTTTYYFAENPSGVIGGDHGF